jgi:hypothetical protein
VREGPAIEGFFPRIIDDALYWRARQARDDRLRRGRGRIGPDYANLVKGLGRCGTCGGSLVYVDKTPISAIPNGANMFICAAVPRRWDRALTERGSPIGD